MNELVRTVVRQPLFIPGELPFQQCHASTLVVLPGEDKLVAFFAGTKEGAADTAIWLCRQQQGTWHKPFKLVDHPDIAQWNPVLHLADGRLWLFYKCGADVQQWITYVCVSEDSGASWSPPRELVVGSMAPRGPVKNKLICLSNGDWLAPNSVETMQHWDARVDKSSDGGQSWRSVAIPCKHDVPVAGPSQGQLWEGLAGGALWETEAATIFRWDGVIQPTLWESEPGSVHMLLRSTRGRIYRSDSYDGGDTWCDVYATSLPNNNSGIDVVRDDNGRLLLVYNPVSGNWGARSPISVTFSEDNGLSWSEPLALENGSGEYSYPAVFFHQGTFHITYTSNRETIIYDSIRLTSGDAILA